MIKKPKLHLVGIFHTQHTAAYSHCAFTGKALRFPKMMQQYGYDVFEYSNEGSEGKANQHFIMLNKNEYNSLYGHRDKTCFYGDDATIGSLGHQMFEGRLIDAIKNNIEPEDIICHPFGHAHQQLMIEFPFNQHVETGIGYPTLMPDSFKIFESYAWMHYHQGKENRNGKNYEWVVPNYYDLDDWEVNLEPEKYLAFLGRITSLKGLDTIKAIADYSPYPIILHGQGNPDPWSHPNIQYRGPIHGKKRSEFLSKATALLAPSVFTEPFCGMTVEAMLCGTPVISVDYGAMTETVKEGMGYRCHTLQDWLDAIDNVKNLDRQWIADQSRKHYSLESCGKKYDKIFMQLNDLHRQGWYEVNCVNFYHIEIEEKPFANRLAEWCVNHLEFKTVFDVGCGPGIYVDSFEAKGFECLGIDIDLRIKKQSNLIQEDLFVFNHSADLVLCLEVAEHIESSKSSLIVEKINSFLNPGGYLIWSAAHPGQGGSGHINCQPKEFWKHLLMDQELIHCLEFENNMIQFLKKGYHMGWFIQNAMVFQKKRCTDK